MISERALPQSPSFCRPAARTVDNGSAKVTLQIWKDVFGSDHIEEGSNFFELGGTPPVAARLQAAFKTRLHIAISTADLLRDPTVAGMADKIDALLAQHRREEVLASSQNVIPIQPRGEGMPVFVISQSMIFRKLALQLGTTQPVYAIAMNEGDAVSNRSSFDEIIDFHLQWIRAVQPHGPYRLAGWCISGWLAYGIARKLEDQGEEIELLTVIDAIAPGYWSNCKLPIKLRYNWRRFTIARKTTSIVELIFKRLPKAQKAQEQAASETLDETASQAQFLGPLKGNMLLFCSEEEPLSVLPDSLGWARLLGRSLEVVLLPGDHHKIFENPGAAIMAKTILAQLGESTSVKAASQSRLIPNLERSKQLLPA